MGGLALSVEHSLLGLIRKDPKALATMFDMTGSNRFDDIQQILNELIVEANNEILQINSSVVTCKAEVASAYDALDVAKQEVSRLQAELEGAELATASAKGDLAAEQMIYDTESPNLLHEIEVYENVTSIIQGLDTDVTLEDLVQIRAFLSTAQQADPDKVQKVIDLLNTLLSAAQQELEHITTALDDANAALDDAEQVEREISGQVASAEAVKDTAETTYNQLNGACSTTESVGVARTTVLRLEIETLNEIVAILNALTR